MNESHDSHVFRFAYSVHRLIRRALPDTCTVLRGFDAVVISIPVLETVLGNRYFLPAKNPLEFSHFLPISITVLRRSLGLLP